MGKVYAVSAHLIWFHMLPILGTLGDPCLSTEECCCGGTGIYPTALKIVPGEMPSIVTIHEPTQRREPNEKSTSIACRFGYGPSCHRSITGLLWEAQCSRRS
jgi:hypothetical protein